MKYFRLVPLLLLSSVILLSCGKSPGNKENKPDKETTESRDMSDEPTDSKDSTMENPVETSDPDESSSPSSPFVPLGRRGPAVESETSEEKNVALDITAESTGDPHLKSVDGMSFDFQGAGEFIYLTSTDQNDPFEIQVRQEPLRNTGCPNVTVNTAVAARMKNTRIHLGLNNQPPLYVNDKPVQMEPGNETMFSESNKLQRFSTDEFRLTWSNGAVLDVKFWGNSLNLFLHLPEEYQEEVRGILGTFNNNTKDDLTLQDGTVLQQPVSWKGLYDKFGESWRVKQENSLFHYKDGNDTTTYTDRSVPARPETLPPSKRKQAEKICREAGITNPILLQDCILDVACSGNKKFADVHSWRKPPSSNLKTTTPVVQWKEGSNGSMMEAGLAVEPSIVEPDKPVALKVHIYNRGSDPVQLPNLKPEGPSDALQLFVDGQRKNNLAVSRPGRRVSPSGALLEPGEGHVVTRSAIFDKKGTYKLFVELHSTEDGGISRFEPVRTGTVTLRVGTGDKSIETADNPTIQLEKETFKQKEPIKITYSGLVDGKQYWILMVPANAGMHNEANDHYRRQGYLVGNEVTGPKGTTTIQEFTTPGRKEIRFYTRNNGPNKPAEIVVRKTIKIVETSEEK